MNTADTLHALDKIRRDLEELMERRATPKHRYTVRRSEHGFAVAIDRDGDTVLHLTEGTTRNEEWAERIVRKLNGEES